MLIEKIGSYNQKFPTVNNFRIYRALNYKVNSPKAAIPNLIMNYNILD